MQYGQNGDKKTVDALALILIKHFSATYVCVILVQNEYSGRKEENRSLKHYQLIIRTDPQSM